VSLILVFRVPDMIRIFMNCRVAPATCRDYPLQIIIFELMANDAFTIDIVGDVMCLQEEL
jgi:hypothetical protein